MKNIKAINKILEKYLFNKLNIYLYLYLFIINVCFKDQSIFFSKC